MLAADAEFEFCARLASTLRRDLDQFADTVSVERDEGIARDHTLRQILVQEHAGIVARQTERGLREIIRAERKELRSLSNLAGAQRRARQLDHGPDHVGRDLAP